jgi:hypothetical protein
MLRLLPRLADGLLNARCRREKRQHRSRHATPYVVILSREGGRSCHGGHNTHNGKAVGDAISDYHPPV